MKSPLSVSPQSQQDVVAQAFAPENLTSQDTAPSSIFWRVALYAALAGVFILYSRFFDLALNGYHIPRIILSVMVLLFFLSGRPLVFLRSGAGKFLLMLDCWAAITVYTGIWKSGSMPAFYQLMQSTLFFAIAASLPVVTKNVRTFMSGLAFSGLVAALMSIPWGSTAIGRLALMDGSYRDPNYYAMCLLAIVPFFWAIAATTRSFVIKLVVWAALLPLFLVIARSGSRGAMLALGFVVLLMLLISPLKTKVLVVLGTTAGVVLAALLMPSYIRERYSTFFDLSDSANQVEYTSGGQGPMSDLDRLHADMSSAEGRKRLLMTSIALSFEHPIFGVGPGNFPAAVFSESEAAGTPHNEWLVTHNSYTEFSSETGFPGLILFLCFIVVGFRCLIYVLRNANENGPKPDAFAHATAKYLLFSLTSLCVCIFFLAVGFEFTVYLWVGMAVSLKRTYDEQPALNEAPLAQMPELAAPVKRTVAPAPATAPRPQPAFRKEKATVSGRPVRFTRFRS